MATKSSSVSHRAKPPRVARRQAPVVKVRADKAPPAEAAGSKLDRIETALRRKNGATIPDLMDLPGWQSQSVRGGAHDNYRRRR